MANTPLTLRLILGDQLNSQHSWFNQVDPRIHYVMMEVQQETGYVVHHIQKICSFFMAMRLFCENQSDLGHSFTYLCLDDASNTQSLSGNLMKLLDDGDYTCFEYLLPDEYRLDQQLINFCSNLTSSRGIKTAAYDTEHFYSTRDELVTRFGIKKTYLMETFYRQMRKEHRLLMDGDQPEGACWNFDSENRKPYDQKTPVPEYIKFPRSAAAIRSLLSQEKVTTLGEMVDDRLEWPLTRAEALQALDYFVVHLLPNFGTFEDAMDTHQPAMFHARLSFVLNIKLVSPKEVLGAAIEAFHEGRYGISLAQVEGFTRQIVGWREFMRSMYWIQMPGYLSLNYFNHQRPLPAWYWTGKTQMNCLHHSIKQSLELAYAHHIQRLMVTGSFALLAGVHPDAVDQWYLGIYIDAIQWVELPNTRGMSQFADGGIVGTKPYVSGANYISKMSNYCKSCHYNPKIRYGEKACPFNSLYWSFFEQRRGSLEKNNRLSLVYRSLEKMTEHEKMLIKRQADDYLSRIDSL